jgi:hypothetical protein
MGLRKHAKGQKAHGKADDASEGEGRQPHFVKNFTKSPGEAAAGRCGRVYFPLILASIMKKMSWSGFAGCG